MNNNLHKKISDFLKQYTQMDIEGVVINCPYWMNRLKNSKVVFRGFANGKGNAKELREELVKRYNQLPPELKFDPNPESLRKFAKRERIGIDCSGFVYRVLNKLVNIDEIFKDGIDKTNVDILTSTKYSRRINNLSDYRVGDLIRINGGKHIAIIADINPEILTYAHSSDLTEIQGVHLGSIKLVNKYKNLSEQIWEEKTRSGENFGKKRFDSKKGDGVFRLRIFQ